VASITGTDSEQTGRLTRDGNSSDCLFPKACPGPINATPVAYDAYTFTNAGPDACVAVNLASACGTGLFSAAYYGIHNPADVCANYAADAGASAPTMNYSFAVPSNGVFTVVVHEIIPGAGCPSYTLTVSGFNCPQRLDIEPAGASRVALKWSTSGVGYRLLSATDLDGLPPLFNPVAGTPFIIGGKYAVTNVTGGAARFYELRKP
jgi:hypothetical protein